MSDNWKDTDGHYLDPAWHPQKDQHRITTQTPDTDHPIIMPVKKEKKK